MRTHLGCLLGSMIAATACGVPLAQDVKPKLAFDVADLTKFAEAKEQLDAATKKVGKFAQGNEAGVTIKGASAKNVTLDLKRKPTGGSVNIVFDVHSRHRTLPDGKKVLGVTLPGIVAYDRHDDLVVEFDIKDGTGRARLIKGPMNLPALPSIPYEVWIPFDIKDK